MDYLAKACEKLNITPERVLSHRITDDEIVLVVDNGIAGCPKSVVSLSEFDYSAKESVVYIPADDSDVSVSTDIPGEEDFEGMEDVDYSSMKVKELKEIAKQRRVKNYQSMRKAELVEALS